MVAAALSPAEVWAALQDVPDPELPQLSILDLGMVRGVEVAGEAVTVRFAPTFSGCPALHTIKDSIVGAMRGLGFREVRVETTLTPPWTSDDITPAGREKLREVGIAPPESTLDLLSPPPTPCPRCGSLDTRVTATFGPALCKRMYVCNTCREPFEGMKSV